MVPTESTFEAIIPQRSDGFVRRPEPANTVAEGMHLDGQLTRGDLNLLLTVTQN